MFSFTTKRVTTAAALVLLLGTAAYASSVHLKPPNSSPTFNDMILVLNATASLSGLGEGDIVINMSAMANPTATCTNGGSHQPPGRNPASVTVTGSQIIPSGEAKNGNVTFSVTTQPPTTPIPSTSPDFSCPNRNWTENITDMSFTSASITVAQGGVTELTISCTFTPATNNQTPVPSGTVTCTAS
jgi:hypothetical protein